MSNHINTLGLACEFKDMKQLKFVAKNWNNSQSSSALSKTWLNLVPGLKFSTSRRATSFNFMDFIEVLPTLSISQKTTKSPFHQEIDQWSVEPPKSGDPVTLWRTFAPDYPALFYCFQKIFSISASSIPVESVFSEASFQVTDLRNRLAPEKVTKMMVISKFYLER